MKRLSILLILCGSSLAAPADDYLETVPQFWRGLYPDGAEGLYCGQQIQPYDRRYNIEHVFPMSWVTKMLKCGDRESCRRNSERFNQIESDMHNMYPARKDLNRARGAMAFGILKGERLYEAGCDFEIAPSKRRVEPRPEVRGNIARAMLYLSDQYGLRIYKKQRKLLLRWHKADSVDAEERRRNRLIERLQGRSNPWIK